MNEDKYCAPEIGRAKRWWLSATLPQIPLDGHFVARVVIRPNWMDRLLILFGRCIVVEQRSEAEPAAASDAMLDSLRSYSRTEPQRWHAPARGAGPQGEG